MNIKTLTSFFRYTYFHITKNNEKKNELLLDDKQFNITLCTVPVIHIALFIWSMVNFFITLKPLPILIVLLLIFITQFICIYISSDRRELQNKIAKEKRERIKKKKEAEERIRRQKNAEDLNRRVQELLKEMQEFYKKAEEEAERARESFRRDFKQEKRNTTYHQTYRQKLESMFGLTSPYTKSELKSAYKNLAKKHHPDMGGDSQKFIEINKAYEYLLKRI
ncbi:DnaJ domain-containing protein [Bacillus velezensis]|uniref:DnaJ domain-containing protein n=1 Tax=Bacillus velezensis TaxID=492670 RepID=UPI001E3043F5|nr:DnaJ domain-containing protein [Bacillus velezensis]